MKVIKYFVFSTRTSPCIAVHRDVLKAFFLKSLLIKRTTVIFVVYEIMLESDYLKEHFTRINNNFYLFISVVQRIIMFKYYTFFTISYDWPWFLSCLFCCWIVWRVVVVVFCKTIRRCILNKLNTRLKVRYSHITEIQ